MATVFIGLGSNLGDRRAMLAEARSRISKIVHALRMSRIFETDPVGDEDQPRYLNAVVSGATDLSPHSLLGEL